MDNVKNHNNCRKELAYGFSSQALFSNLLAISEIFAPQNLCMLYERVLLCTLHSSSIYGIGSY
jgi:hypothetical protein